MTFTDPTTRETDEKNGSGVDNSEPVLSARERLTAGLTVPKKKDATEDDVIVLASDEQPPARPASVKSNGTKRNKRKKRNSQPCDGERTSGPAASADPECSVVSSTGACRVSSRSGRCKPNR